MDVSSLPRSQAVPAGQAGSFLQLNMTERFGMDGGGKGIPAQGVPVLPLANSPVGQCWGIPHSPSLLKPAFQATPPVAAGWWLPVMTFIFSVSPESETDVLLTKINSLMQE